MGVSCGVLLEERLGVMSREGLYREDESGSLLLTMLAMLFE